MQMDNGSKFKSIYLMLIKRFSIFIINDRSRRP